MSKHENIEVRLAERPRGLPGDACWKVARTECAEPADGEFLVRNAFVSVDPAMRGWMNEGKSYIAPVEIGEVMRAICVAEVVESKHPDFAPGDHVTGLFGVQVYALSDGEGVNKVDPQLAPLPMYLAALGMPGMTAYFGLIDVGRVETGDMVVVSAAAGAVGQVVGQIAKIRGCDVVGIAGGPEKCAYVTTELGFDACIDYKNEKVGAALKQYCPDGIDIYFDNVGGDILDAALGRLARGARVVICGAISQYNNEGAMRGPKNYMSLLVNRASMEGFVVFDYVRRYGDAAREIGGWLADGRLKCRLDIVKGLPNFPETLRRLYTGENFGKLLIEV